MQEHTKCATVCDQAAYLSGSRLFRIPSPQPGVQLTCCDQPGLFLQQLRADLTRDIFTSVAVYLSLFSLLCTRTACTVSTSMDTYERTYSTSLGLSPEALDALRLSTSTSNDYAIACALAGVPEAKAIADTSMDAELALQLHEREASKLLRQPSRRAHRRSKRLRSMLRHLKPTRVSAFQQNLHPCRFHSADWWGVAGICL